MFFISNYVQLGFRVLSYLIFLPKLSESENNIYLFYLLSLRVQRNFKEKRVRYIYDVIFTNYIYRGVDTANFSTSMYLNLHCYFLYFYLCSFDLIKVFDYFQDLCKEILIKCIANCNYVFFHSSNSLFLNPINKFIFHD